ncbi:probable E3 ubiquitin-protein ligase HERC2 [Manduca sexta]|uniref:probable E3 ubiquitin-protein ligase HERC2 n=1 Tax=Manduca sexta TaxID=7130 RepID=UPI00188E4870|nr:probable E3 ubiquitin-protein ligase HERC2 [Manduca sexta]
MHLVKHLIQNTSCQTQMHINAIIHGDTSKTDDPKGQDTVSPSCDLLTRFQRLLFCEAMWCRGGRGTRAGVRALLAHYAQLLADHVHSTLGAFCRALHRADDAQLVTLCDLIATDIVGRVISELSAWVCACSARSPNALAECTTALVRVARACDEAARALPSAARLDADMLGWPGLVSKRNQLNNTVIRKCDLQNHTKEGGSWIIIAGYVFDVEHFECDDATTTELVRKMRGCDATVALSVAPHAAYMSRLTEKCVGMYADQIYSHKCKESISSLRAYHILSSSAFQLALGLSQCGTRLARSLLCNKRRKTPRPTQLLCSYEGDYRYCIETQLTNPFEEEKAEARSGSSTGGNSPASEAPLQPSRATRAPRAPPRHATAHARADALLHALAEPKLHDPLALHLWWACERREGCAPHFPPEHPLEELRRALLAALLYHAGLKEHALATATAGNFETTKDLRNRQNSLSKSMLKATGSLLQGDALLIKSSIANTSSKTPEDITPSIVIEPSRGQIDGSGDPRELQIKLKLKTKDKPLDKDLKNASNYDDMRNEGRAERVMERDDIDKENDDKTPTNEISISSINDMTDNSILKESME